MVEGLFGVEDVAPPLVHFLEVGEDRPRGCTMFVGAGPDGIRTVYITPKSRLHIARTKDEHKWMGATRTARKALLHEWSHVYQLVPLGEESNLMASRFARAHSAIFSPKRKGKPVPFKPYRDRGQFGANFGLDPQTIPWPAP